MVDCRIASRLYGVKVYASDYLRHWTGLVAKVGNLCVGRDTLIFNLTSAARCPAGKNCQIYEFNASHGPGEHDAQCYAKRDENMRPVVMRAHMRQENLWRGLSRDHKVEALRALVNYRACWEDPFYFVRLSEAGDIPNQRDLDLLCEVALWAYEVFGLVTYTYTSMKRLDFSRVPKCFVIKSSGSVDFTGRGRFLIIGQRAAVPAGFVECPGECEPCVMCKSGVYDVACRNHAPVKVQALAA